MQEYSYKYKTPDNFDDIILTSDGNYSFKNDDEIYNIILGLEETKDHKIDWDMKLYDLRKPENSEMNDA